MPGVRTIARSAFVCALLLKSFLVAPGIPGPPYDPNLYTDRCQRCWVEAGSPPEFINTMYKTNTFNSFPCSAFSHVYTCLERVGLQGYYCVRCRHFLNVSLGACSIHGQFTQCTPDPRRPQQGGTT
ncbi:uncharacterized protein PGTG_14039 [Puccinia graminis f. sp. tritici CRL 75-36-700-3]|uniref:Uncharacterized protein n=1 Tax=Puccinia graminis f. sp. tritici (strain CRL 75-36-700-3 / race SCCL) TaxID=418459 RepID=E3KVY6_PUCGT|nr:uncharacterized protein PGTG_14039 [Puccinia graminis f. sp. tritici CRL 75-36-700-3]EFP88461.2 hypothetical protein PGTG_14039 [Puccinia graminis f. sp. tritici CRL 75-36-700-3]